MSERFDPVEDFRGWQAQTVTDNAFECTPIDLQESREWHLDNGFWRHRTGNWFLLAGVEAEARDRRLDGKQQLIIVQRQVAINGFLSPIERRRRRSVVSGSR